MTSLLVFKLILTPLLIAVVSLAGRRWGPAVSGWLVGLPLTSGPIALFLALEYGPAFAAHAATGTLLGSLALTAFAVAYVRLARHRHWAFSLLGSWIAYLLVAAVLNLVFLPPVPAFAAVVLAMLGALYLVRTDRTGASTPRTAPAPRWEIPLRMVVATAFVVGLTALAERIGPQWSGILSTFPLFTTILAVFAHRFLGSAGAAQVGGGAISGAFSFAVFFLAVAALLEPWGIIPAFSVATGAALALHSASLRFVRVF
jgi:hypothetical protein